MFKTKNLYILDIKPCSLDIKQGILDIKPSILDIKPGILDIKPSNLDKKPSNLDIWLYIHIFGLNAIFPCDLVLYPCWLMMLFEVSLFWHFFKYLGLLWDYSTKIVDIKIATFISIFRSFMRILHNECKYKWCNFNDCYFLWDYFTKIAGIKIVISIFGYYIRLLNKEFRYKECHIYFKAVFLWD